VLALAATGAGPDRPPVLEGGDRRPTPRWVSVTPPGAAWVSSVGVDSGSQLYVATDAGVFRSPDGGATWTVPNAAIESLRDVQRFVFDPTEPSTVYGVTLSGVLKSTDRSESWRSLGGSAGSLSYVTALAVDPSSPQTLYAATYYGVFSTSRRRPELAARESGFAGFGRARSRLCGIYRLAFRRLALPSLQASSSLPAGPGQSASPSPLPLNRFRYSTQRIRFPLGWSLRRPERS